MLQFNPLMRHFFILLFALTTISVIAQNPSSDATVWANYKYEVATNELDSTTAVATNMAIDAFKHRSHRGWTDLRDAIITAYKSSLTQKTLNATSNVVDLGVTYVSELVKATSKHFQEWSDFKRMQCTYKNVLTAEDKVEDFYYLPSSNGALDPLNLKFNGFTCRKYLELSDTSMGQKGHDVFYLRCSLRTDSLGIAHMTNHSKFLLEVDTLVYYPKYSNLPNPQRGSVKEFFSYDKYSNLQLGVNVKVLSSWVNEAVIFNSDQQLGEFNINVTINESNLQVIDGDSVFVYIKNKNNGALNVNVSGDSFIVPRSYVGTLQSPLWGTGQYTLLIEVAENCQLNPKHYIKPVHVGNAKAVSFANLPEYSKWRKEVWKEEWRAIDKVDAREPFWKQALQQIKVAYIGDNWVKEFIDPIATQLYNFEAKELKSLFSIEGNSPTSNVGSKPIGGNTK